MLVLTQLTFKIIKVPGQLLLQRCLHAFFVAGFAGARLENAIAEDAEGRQRCEFVVGVFLQPANLRTLCRIAAVQANGFWIGLFEVLADHAGVGEAEFAILERRNAPQWIKLQIPLWWREWHDYFELIIQCLFEQAEVGSADEG